MFNSGANKSKGLWKGCVIVSLVLNAFSLTTLFFVFSVNRSLIALRDLPAEQIFDVLNNESSVKYYLDVLSYSNEVGRLDIISLLLAFLGIVIVVFTVGYFVYIRSDARNAAREEARNEIKENSLELIKKEVSSHEIKNILDDIVRARVEDLCTEQAISKSIDKYTEESVANKIADSFKDE